MTSPTRPTVALALGSGGARGYAHIGVIQVLAERGFDIVAVAGSSMGALVGGVHAAGQLDEYTEWVTGLTQLDVVRLLDLSLAAPGAIRAEKIVGRVRELLHGRLIEDLPIPYTAVATDLGARKEVWFQRGPIEVAIRASIAIPGVITPVMLNGRLLADGGIMDPVPIAPMAAVHADHIIAVSLAGEHRDDGEGARDLESATPRPVDEWTDRFRRSASNLLDRDLVRSVVARFGGGEDLDGIDIVVPGDASPVASEPADPRPDDRDLDPPGPFGPLPAGLSKFDMMSQSLDAMQSALLRFRLAGYPPDVLVSVPKNACRSLEFHRAAEMIDLGRTLTVDALTRAGLDPEPDRPAPAAAPASSDAPSREASPAEQGRRR